MVLLWFGCGRGLSCCCFVVVGCGLVLCTAGVVWGSVVWGVVVVVVVLLLSGCCLGFGGLGFVVVWSGVWSGVWVWFGVVQCGVSVVVWVWSRVV